MDSYKPLSPQIFSIFILVPIAIDDFYAETRPLNEMLISRNIKKVILTLWTCSLIFSPLVFANRHLETQKRSYFFHTHRECSRCGFESKIAVFWKDSWKKEAFKTRRACFLLHFYYFHVIIPLFSDDDFRQPTMVHQKCFYLFGFGHLFGLHCVFYGNKIFRRSTWTSIDSLRKGKKFLKKLKS